MSSTLCYNGHMIFRLTKKTLDYVKASYEDDAAPQNKFSDWFVDVIDSFDEEKYFLLTNAYSLFSVVILSKNLNSKDDFVKTAMQEIKLYFEHAGISDLFLSFIEPNTDKAIITKTNSRKVLGTMNSFICNFPYTMNFLKEKQNNSSLLFMASDKLNKTPSKNPMTENSEYIFPNDFISSNHMTEPLQTTAIKQAKKVQEKPVYKIKAELCELEKEIWREFIISPNITMETFAFSLMTMFDMDGSHLYRFEIKRRKQKEKEFRKKGFSKYQIEDLLKTVRDIEIQSYVDEEMDASDDDFMIEMLKQQPPERFEAYAVKLIKFLNKENPEIHFIYDFGDNWDIKITLKKSDFMTDIPPTSLPFITAGQGSGIIEDCGGAYGLKSIKKAFEAKNGEDYEQYKDWLGVDDIDLSTFDVEKSNKNIAKQIKSFKKSFLG